MSCMMVFNKRFSKKSRIEYGVGLILKKKMKFIEYGSLGLTRKIS